MKRTELQRKTPLAAKTPLKRTPMARSSVPLARSRLVQKAPKPKLTPKRKRALVDRSEGLCEIGTKYCTYFAQDPCHRVGEGSGGRHGEAAEVNDRLSNVLHGCRACHEWTHQFPRSAELNGFRLTMLADPKCERVNYRSDGWALLDDEGGVTRCESS